jgi:DNA-binding FadR family transcriptional regulator
LWKARGDEVDTRFHQHLLEVGEVREHILGDHEAIVAAVVSGNADAARNAMAKHLQFVADAMLQAWE